ncbi:hypothetical protein IFM89_026470 [Coptis chinensis]|uniref:G-patch domain-containing protein n=1 Tax=Coptis chinensis TaxID=261450 RepID=A0A835IF47_9MAGN|nr:hypothetical protein IFM89_026470 [Coptis chinensis]
MKPICFVSSFTNLNCQSADLQVFLQQRCRFSTNCACHMRKAELESWDDTLGLAQVVFQDDGSSRKVDGEGLSLSEYAQMSNDEEEEDSASEQSYDSDDEESLEGLGFMEAAALQRGIQTDTAVFAKWENHTRGIAAKMMANMGYREGMGLGASGQGMVDPITVKRRSRGGKRKRDKKYAAAERAKKEQEEFNPDVFSFINNQLATQIVHQNGSLSKRQSKDFGESKNEDRKSLIAYDNEVRDLRVQVEKLEEMVNRNRKEKVVYEAFSRKLSETRKALADAEAVQASASNAVVSKEKEKRWLKF